MKKLAFSLLLIRASLCLYAQDYYTIQVGTFVDAKPGDFAALQSVGFVHADKVNENLYTIYLGGYDNRAAAEKAWSQVRAKGYLNAFIQERYNGEGEIVSVVQIATKSASKPIEWEKFVEAGELFALINNDNIKLVVGVFANSDAAKQSLEALRKAGFKDAFVKNVNTITLHRLSAFETGEKKALIPLELNSNTSQNPAAPQPYDQIPPRSYDEVLTIKTPNPTTPTLKKNATAVSYVPKIRSNVKRRAALELQKVLKAEKFYTGSLDGYYGAGTIKAYDAMKNSNREWQKYLLLSKNLQPIGLSTTNSQLQQAINDLPDDPSSTNIIENAKTPIAKAYQAYLMFSTLGAGKGVNSLMNAALREAYGGKLTAAPPFDHRATYSYDNIEQLLLHIHYIHSAPGNDIVAPCWLFQRHPNEMARVYERYASIASNTFPLRGCDQFLSWEEIGVAHAIAVDLNANQKIAPQLSAQAASLRILLYLRPQPVDAAAYKELQSWQDKLWTGLNGWATRDPINKQLVTAFKLAYFQSLVRLEDYFMDKGMSADDAKALALAAVRTIVGNELERFI